MVAYVLDEPTPSSADGAWAWVTGGWARAVDMVLW